MSFTAPRAVASGKAYAVRSVRDRIPVSLDDFVGDTAFVLDLDGEDYLVAGPGIHADPGVRVFEKDDDGFGKDIRTWTVCPAPSRGAFTALHLGPEVPPQAVQGVLP